MAATLTRFMLDLSLWWPCENRISLLCLPGAAPTPVDFSDEAPSLFKPCKTCNKLQHVITGGSSAKALLCGVLGGTSALVRSARHPALLSDEPPMPPSAHCAYGATWEHSLSLLLPPHGCLLLLRGLGAGNTGKRTEFLTPAQPWGVYVCVCFSFFQWW